MGQSWDNHETIMVQSWDSHGTIMRQSQQWKCKHDTQTICARVYIHYNLSIQNIQHLNVKSSFLIRHSVVFILQQWFTVLVHGLVQWSLISFKAYRLVWKWFIVCLVDILKFLHSFHPFIPQLLELVVAMENDYSNELAECDAKGCVQ